MEQAGRNQAGWFWVKTEESPMSYVKDLITPSNNNIYLSWQVITRLVSFFPPPPLTYWRHDIQSCLLLHTHTPNRFVCRLALWAARSMVDPSQWVPTESWGGVIAKGLSYESGTPPPRFESKLCHEHAKWPWSTCSLSTSARPMCKMGANSIFLHCWFVVGKASRHYTSALQV